MLLRELQGAKSQPNPTCELTTLMTNAMNVLRRLRDYRYSRYARDRMFWHVRPCHRSVSTDLPDTPDYAPCVTRRLQGCTCNTSDPRRMSSNAHHRHRYSLSTYGQDTFSGVAVEQDSYVRNVDSNRSFEQYTLSLVNNSLAGYGRRLRSRDEYHMGDTSLSVS